MRSWTGGAWGRGEGGEVAPVPVVEEGVGCGWDMVDGGDVGGRLMRVIFVCMNGMQVCANDFWSVL